jgi:hypothetical protein
LGALVAGHAERVTRTPRTLRVEASGPSNAAFMRDRVAWNYTLRVETPRRYRFEGREQYPVALAPPSAEPSVETVATSIYADGETVSRQRRSKNGTNYLYLLLETSGDASGYTTDVADYLRTFLAGSESTVECAGTLADGDCFAYRAVVTGTPSALADDAADYRAVAVIQDNGAVSSLDVRYTLPDGDGDGEREAVRFTVKYDIGPVAVSSPDWVATAKNESS